MTQLPERWKGSISEGTLHPKHLIPRFVAVLETADPNHDLVVEWTQVEGALMTLADYLNTSPHALAEDVGLWEVKSSGHFLSALFDALNVVAPEGTFFGSAEGDGASFGFWDMTEDGDAYGDDDA